MLSGERSYEEELAGVEEVEPKKPLKEECKEEDTYDFDLGPLSIDSYLSDTGNTRKKSRSKEDKSKSYQKLFDSISTDEEEENEDKQLTKSIGKYATGNRDLDMVTQNMMTIMRQSPYERARSFDSLFDDESDGIEEDMQMHNNLISLGRKYARDNAATKEETEINKSFAESEKKYRELYEEISKDKADIQKDIDRMRVPGRGGKAMSDMISVKKEMHMAQISIIDKMNTMRAKMYELKAKEAARKEAEAGNNDISTNTLQSIFSGARGALVKNMGGYGSISGAINDDDEVPIYNDEEDDEEIQRKYFSNRPQGSSDGDKFLEYEDRGVEWVLIVDADNNVQSVIAEDRDGIYIPDYPIPENIHELTFDIDKIAMTATDNFHRNYKVRVEE